MRERDKLFTVPASVKQKMRTLCFLSNEHDTGLICFLHGWSPQILRQPEKALTLFSQLFKK
jgi:hypothetical protein